MAAILTLANCDDAYNFHRGMHGQFTPHRPWWQRLWRWLLRKKTRPALFLVTAVDRKSGTVTVEPYFGGDDDGK